MRVFPVGLRLEGRRCVVFGSSSEQGPRALAWLKAGAHVVVVASVLSEQLEHAKLAGSLQHIARGYQPGDLAGAWLAVQVDSDRADSDALFREAEERQVFFCAVDQPQASFAHLAIAQAGELLVAISTNGRVPALAARLRRELELLFERSRTAEQVERLARLRDATPGPDRRGVLTEALRNVRLEGELRFEPPTPAD